MRIVIVGAGEVGYHVAERLSKEQHDVVVVDVDRKRLDYVETHIDVAVVEGSGVNPVVLEEAGIDSAPSRRLNRTSSRRRSSSPGWKTATTR